jgi:hypothetical protein
MLSEVVGPVSTHLVAEEDALLAHTATARTDPFTCTPRTPRQHGAGAASMRLFRPRFDSLGFDESVSAVGGSASVRRSTPARTRTVRPPFLASQGEELASRASGMDH